MNKRKIVSKILKYSGALHLLRKLSDTRTLRILMYHRVVNKTDDFSYYLEGVAPDDFDTQMNFLSRYFSVLPLEEVLARVEDGKPLPKNAVSITIDDGYRDCYSHIYPVLKKYDLSATIFLTTDNIGSKKTFWVDTVGRIFKKGKPRERCYEHGLLGRIEVDYKTNSASLDNVVRKLKTVSEIDKNAIIEDLRMFFGVSADELRADYNLTWQEVREMSDDGIHFGAHTVTHPILTKLPLEMAGREIMESKTRIETELGKPVIGFCYPNGENSDFNNSIIDILKKEGFKYAVTAVWGFNDTILDPFRLRRVGPNSDDEIAVFDYIVSSGFELTNRLKSLVGRRKR